MTLAVKPPLAPMLARLERELPRDGYLVDRGRFRHPARFSRWGPDLDPRACTLAQFAR